MEFAAHEFMFVSIYGSSALVDLGRYFSFLIHTKSVGLLGRGISSSQGRYLHTEQRKYRINAHRHPYLEWDSNPRSQRSSGRRRFMPKGASTLLVLVLFLARLVLVWRLVWLLLVLVILRPHYFSCSPG
jgi:hypothetical protein